MQVKVPDDLLDPSMHFFSEPADSVHPAKAFFDSLPDFQADGIVRIVGGSAVNHQLPVDIFLDPISAVELAEFFDETCCVVALVTAQSITLGCS